MGRRGSGGDHFGGGEGSALAISWWEEGRSRCMLSRNICLTFGKYSHFGLKGCCSHKSNWEQGSQKISSALNSPR